MQSCDFYIKGIISSRKTHWIFLLIKSPGLYHGYDTRTKAVKCSTSISAYEIKTLRLIKLQKCTLIIYKTLSIISKDRNTLVMQYLPCYFIFCPMYFGLDRAIVRETIYNDTCPYIWKCINQIRESYTCVFLYTCSISYICHISV
jgi:hypothetical protein